MNLPQRRSLILQGDAAWCQQQAQACFQQIESAQRLWLSESEHSPAEAVPIKQSTRLLGREFSLLVFDAQQDFNADAFAAIIGALKAGGLLIILLSGQLPQSLWLQRFLSAYQQQNSSFFCFVRQGQGVIDIKIPSATGPSLSGPTDEQQQAIEAVLKIVSGHRRRPLVLSSDRGRGKSALLGMAAAQLLKNGKQRIIVTAPGLAQVGTLLSHARQQLPDAEQQQSYLNWQQASIEFFAPDVLLAQAEKADLLIVDEAAVIPLPMLEKMLKIYSRIVFSTTVHGYEGTGRGFVLRFYNTLDAVTPNWRRHELKKPIRWIQDDVLEIFSLDALLMNAEPVVDELIIQAQPDSCRFEVLSRQQLLADETALRELFGLMVQAHYRTRPSDLQRLLDNKHIRLVVLKYQHHIVAAVWLVDEMPLPADLAGAVYHGKRKPKGHLLPQSLLLHVGISQAGELHYQRVVRIAVHPAVQGKGLGSCLLDCVADQAGCDVLGTSYALDADVYRFWLKNGYQTVRLGQHADQVTGSVSVMMLKPLSQAAQSVHAQARAKLQAQWPLLLSRSLRNLPALLVHVISAELYVAQQDLDENSLAQIHSFAFQQRPFESVEIVLWQWLQTRLGTAAFNQLTQMQQSLLIQLVMQQQPMQFVAQHLGLSGRAQLIQSLRETVAVLL